MNDINWLQQIVNAVWLGGVYSLFSLGYSLVFSVLGVLNLAHSAIFMWGAFIGLWFVLQLGLSVWLSIPLAMIGAALISVALERIAFAPLRQRNAPRISQLISSIGASILLVSIAQLVFGTQPQRFPLGSIPTDVIPGLPFRVTPIQVIILLVALGLVAALNLLITRTKTGQAMRAVAFNEKTASLLGIHVGRVFMLTFALAGALAGAAGVLYGLAYNSMTPFIGEQVALKGLTVIVLGGMGSIQGAVIGGFVVAGLEVFSIAQGGSNYRDAIVFALLFVILLVRPQGLVGQKAATRA
ncbi:MAG: branched-chain amino acid ABC transporter permease [Anaerolineae bacterium]|nr:branched-chain amino acid ABC transporter permease [Anaerolineae bacterium]